MRKANYKTVIVRSDIEELGIAMTLSPIAKTVFCVSIMGLIEGMGFAFLPCCLGYADDGLIRIANLIEPLTLE